MPTSEVVRYGVGGKHLANTDSSSFGSGGEDWVTRKRVETKTTKNIERRVQRQVVLEDGRVIEEDDPEVTVDTIEDTQSHSDDADDDLKNFDYSGSVIKANGEWQSGLNVVGEKLQRNTYTTNVEQKTVTTASANNLGDISTKDIDVVINRGKKASSLAKTKDYTGEPVAIPARVVHKNAARKRTVDKEDIQEVSHLSPQGKLRTDRVVSRECIQDHEDQTPSEGESTEETESHDGDRDGFSQRKEDRYIDYYQVPKGKSFREGKLIRKGLHMSSYDKSDQRGGALNYTSQGSHRALRYDSDSTTASGQQQQQQHRKPPKADRPPSRGRRSNTRYSSSEREDVMPPRQPVPKQRFHTIERSRHVGRDKQGTDRAFYEVTAASSTGDVDDSSRYYRSRSMSRSPTQVPPQRPAKHHHRSLGNIMRGDLDSEREGRLRRAMSFSSTKSDKPVTSTKSPHDHKSFLDSVKSLYASISKAATGSKVHKGSDSRVSAANKAWFDQGGPSPPQRPPRKPRSTSSAEDRSHRSTSSLNVRKKNVASLNQSFQGTRYHQQHQPHHQRSDSFVDGGASQQRQWEVHSTSSLPRQPQRPMPQPRTAATPQQQQPSWKQQTSTWKQPSLGQRRTSSLSRDTSVRTGRSSSEAINAYATPDNRDAPRFERSRDTSSRFFGQRSGAAGQVDDDSEVVERSRPPPDMRRLLLNNVNVSRSKSMSKTLDQKPSVIRAI